MSTYSLTVSNSQSLLRSTIVKERRYTLLQALFPPARAEILRRLFSSPQKERYVRELIGMSGLRLCAIQDELRKLSALQLITSRYHRRHRFYRANREHAAFRVLVHLIETNERAPQLAYWQLHRKKSVRSRRHNKLAHLPPDRPLKWGLFSQRNAT
jgi:DNA-binding transcriptional ArsR family regulator